MYSLFWKRAARMAVATKCEQCDEQGFSVITPIVSLISGCMVNTVYRVIQKSTFPKHV
jgi:hypothetical protein